MDALTPEQLGELRQLLEAELRRLERSMKTTEEAARPVELDQTAVGRLSRMDSLQSQGMAKNLREREKVKLARIQQAFRRLEEGSYGICKGCGEALPYGRLLVFPEAGTCAACGEGT